MTAQPQGERVSVGFTRCLKLECHGAKVTSDAGLLAYRDLDDTLELFDGISSLILGPRTGCNIQHPLSPLLRQSIYSHRVDRAMQHTFYRRVILDLDSSQSPVHGHQEGAAYQLAKVMVSQRLFEVILARIG